MQFPPPAALGAAATVLLATAAITSARCPSWLSAARGAALRLLGWGGAAGPSADFERQPSADADGLYVSMRKVLRRTSFAAASTDVCGQAAPIDPAARRLREVVQRSCAASADPHAVDLVARRADLRCYDAGEVIVRQGSPGDTYYLIETGQCEVSMAPPGRPESPRPVTVLGVDDAFGEQALLGGASALCAATVTAASSPTRCWAVDAATYRAALGCHVVRARARYAPLLAKVAALQGVREYARGRIADLLQPVEVAPGATVFNQGDTGDAFYVVETGSCIVESNGAVLAELGPGGHFGETALLSGSPRSARVRGGDRGAQLARLDARSFERHLRAHEVRLAMQPAGLPPPDHVRADDCGHAQLYLDYPDVDEEDEWAGFGATPPGADRAACYRWLVAALERIERGDHRYKGALRLVLANCRLHARPDDPGERCFGELRRVAKKRMRAIGERQERGTYHRLGLARALRGLGSPDAVRTARVRQDDPVVLGPFPPPEAFSDTLAVVRSRVGGLADYLVSAEHVYDYAVLLLASAMDSHFQRVAKSACEGAGGAFRAAAVKSRQRVAAKRRADHSTAPSPQAAENLDLNRCAWSFSTVEGLRHGFAAACKCFGEPLRVKNGYDPGFDALGETGGYRAVLLNFVFSADKLWTDLTSTESAPLQWEALWRASTRGMTEGLRACVFRQYFEAAKQLVQSAHFADRTAALVVEVQLLTDDYLAMRKRTHLWYKVARACSPLELCMDFRI